MTCKKIILTGAPHAGKTSTLEELKNQGHYIIDESAIEVICALTKLLGDQEYQAWRNENFPSFASLIGHRQKALEEKIDETKQIVFIDRGLIDNLAFTQYFDHPTTKDNKTLAESAQYDKIFLLEIIEPFNGRSETGRSENRDTAYGIQKQLIKTHHDYGFDVTLVPQMSIKDRVSFILERSVDC